MKRVRATQLALVNWRGVFYERYQLDPQVTALEGVNGAGKTTVMIALYVVLMPEINRLRFTNLGEHSPVGGDRGIYGRLGDPGKPSYSVLDLRLARKERLLAGIHLERRSEPTVELTAFIITGLDADVPLQDILLDRTDDLDAVPELARLRELAALAGGQLKSFNVLRDYFAALFDRGVLPLRMGNEEERHKFNDMLRTSMVGGISSALTGGLREYLLREETGLADTLKLMRANLDACRATRLKVEESSRLEHDIRVIYESGQEMFAAALQATRERSRETEERVRDKNTRLQDAERRRDKLSAELEEWRARLERSEQEFQSTQNELQLAEERLQRTRQAHGLCARIANESSERAQQSALFEVAERDRLACEEMRLQARNRLAEARRSEDEAADSLTSHEAGFARLQHEAALHRAVTRQLEEARALLPEEALEPADLEEPIARLESQIQQRVRTIVELDRELETAVRRREEFAEVQAALETLAGEPIAAVECFERARACLCELRRQEDLASRREDLQQQLQLAKQRAKEQALARQMAWPLSTVEQPIRAAEHVRAAHARAAELYRTAEQTKSREETAAGEAAARREAAERESEALEGLRIRWLSLRETAERSARRWQRPAGGREELGELQAFLQQRREEVRSDLAGARERRQALLAEASLLEQSGGRFPETLLKARDLVEGELLAGRFEDVETADSARLQALLGPLHEAILVEDARAAAERLSSAPERPETVWLLSHDQGLSLEDLGEILGDNVVAAGAFGTRLTRFPARPTLGRRARQRRIEELRKEAQTYSSELEAHSQSLRELEEGLEAVLPLLPEAALLERADPEPELASARAAALRAAEERDRHRKRADEQAQAVRTYRDRQEGLLALLPQAWLLDLPDQEPEVARLAAQVQEAQRAHADLQEIAEPRALVEHRLEVLRRVPPTDEQLARFRSDKARAETERDHLARPLACLVYVRAHREALAWSHAEKALEEQASLEPAVRESLKAARDARERAQASADEAESALAAAVKIAQNEQGRLSALDASLERLKRELAALDCPDASDEALNEATLSVEEHKQRSQALSKLETRHREQWTRTDEKLATQKTLVETCLAELEQEESQHRPALERWERLQAQAEEHGLLVAARAYEFTEKGSPNLSSRAAQAKMALMERLNNCPDGKELASSIQTWRSETTDTQAAELYLQAWLDVRDWLRRRVPPQIAEVDEPLEALQRLRGYLAGLVEKLHSHEKNLRGQSSDVARNIRGRIRKARGEINKLNVRLKEVRFGSIQSVQVRVREVDKMTAILEALKEDEAQSLLFGEMPIEQAMDELFKRYAGGRIGGEKLLDYREYITLQVEVKRAASSDWEPANPTRMSTGEAIGVGAAVMMVVLTAWESEANLLRKTTSFGSLRFLLLDEATRLSQDNLVVLFELCKNLELQLLIAAPEVAEAEGNTTYRLVRTVEDDRYERVRVTGRRLATCGT